MKSSAYKTKQHLGAKGKGRPCQNYHTYFKKILKSFIDNQGKKNPYICGSELEKRLHLFKFFLLLS